MVILVVSPLARGMDGDKLLAMLDVTLTRPDDRALFDLPEPVTEPAFLDGKEPVEPPSRITLPRS